MEKYFGMYFHRSCRTEPFDFGNDPLSVKELVLVETTFTADSADLIVKFIENNSNLENLRLEFIKFKQKKAS